ncbi:uncharacterized protein LOC129240143 isoform X2 [Anastrepha obliqua]|uniref:uncharacterized protein LOC129240143 isoform X2 n=1 Tax=Anastrepha obliqua TaxID=95512 RepID=UPI00240A7069|nr:uncharacterized protein LOC129240143 isoform X2 [Anastrepha obliqua]
MTFNEMLIEEVRKHRCIYDVSLKEFGSELKKAWREIGKVLNANPKICKQRWNTLRDTYKRMKRTNEPGSSSGAPIPNRKWKFQEVLSFLDDCRDKKSIKIVEPTTIVLEDMGNTIPEKFTLEEDTDSQSSYSSASSSGTAIERLADAELKSSLAKAMGQCLALVTDLVKVPQKNSTFSLFESFAQKIVDANLPQADVNRIEAKVMLLLHEELAKFYK